MLFMAGLPEPEPSSRLKVNILLQIQRTQTPLLLYVQKCFPEEKGSQVEISIRGITGICRMGPCFWLFGCGACFDSTATLSSSQILFTHQSLKMADSRLGFPIQVQIPLCHTHFMQWEYPDRPSTQITSLLNAVCCQINGACSDWSEQSLHRIRSTEYQRRPKSDCTLLVTWAKCSYAHKHCIQSFSLQIMHMIFSPKPL